MNQSLKVCISSDLYSTNNIYKTFNCFNCAAVEKKKARYMYSLTDVKKKKEKRTYAEKHFPHKYRTNEVKEIIAWFFSSFS